MIDADGAGCGPDVCRQVVLDEGDVEVLDEERRDVLVRHARVIASGGDPDQPLTAAQAFRPPPGITPSQGLGLLAAMTLVLVSGFAGGILVDSVGVRFAAALLLALAVFAARRLRGDSSSGAPALAATDRRLLLGILAFAVLTGSVTALALLPAVVHLAVARFLLASLGDERSLIEKAARLSHPLAPSFIASYCRKLTAVWGLLFAASAGLTAVLASGGDAELHRAWTGWMFWSLLAVFSAVEFLWRKARFRYFGKGPFDRLLARVFPPEKTARGRRSLAYLLAMRAELARLARIARSGSPTG